MKLVFNTLINLKRKMIISMNCQRFNYILFHLAQNHVNTPLKLLLCPNAWQQRTINSYDHITNYREKVIAKRINENRLEGGSTGRHLKTKENKENGVPKPKQSIHIRFKSKQKTHWLPKTKPRFRHNNTAVLQSRWTAFTIA